MELLSEKLWCSGCNIPLSFRNTEQQICRGLATVFHVRCTQCLKIIKVSTSKRVPGDLSRSRPYEINLKAALGVGVIVGLHTGDVLGFETRNKRCMMCDLRHDPSTHDCRKNWSGSSKAMEADVAKSLVVKNESMEEVGVRVGVLIGDDDSSTIAGVRNIIDTPILKWSDINHATASVVKALYGLQKKHKKLTTKVIKHLKWCFGCAIRFNKYEATAVAKQLRTIVDHVYDHHQNCATSWCKHHEDPLNYKHIGLPHGKALDDENMRADLAALFNRLAEKSDQLAPCGSSQRNESFNAMATHRICKARHYGGSEALDYLVAATVASKNLGCSYVAEVKKKLLMPRGKYTLNHKEKRQNERVRRSMNARKKENRKKRYINKTQKNQHIVSKESAEGISYQSGMGLFTVPAVLTTSTPYAISNDSVVVMFDVETTGLGMTTELCQLAAKVSGTDNKFMRYILPKKNFSSRATETNGFIISNGKLMLHGGQVITTPLAEVYAEFIQFLKDNGSAIVLLGHNANKFDTRLVLRDVQNLGMLDEFAAIVTGFGDTLPLLKKAFPKRPSYKLSEIALAELGETAICGIHDALRDCEVLDEVIVKALDSSRITKEALVRSCVGTAAYLQKENCMVETAHFKSLLKPLHGHVSAGILKKLAENRLTLEILSQSYVAGGAESVKVSLAESVDGKAKVTRSKRILESIVNFIASINA